MRRWDMKNTIKSLALLKTVVDQHPEIKDYLDVFLPFLITLVKKRKITNLRDIENLCLEFYDEFGLRIPHHPMITLVNKFLANGYGEEIAPEDYQPIKEKLDEGDLTWASQELEVKFNLLIENFIQFSQKKHAINLSEEDASKTLLLLLNDHDLDIMFVGGVSQSILPDTQKSTTGINLAYDFVRSLYESSSPDFEVMANVAFGHIIASMILFEFEIKPSKDLSKVNYYLDTGILFGLFGINGEYEKRVYEDFLRLLTTNNGRIFIFDHTYDEFVKIVSACKDWIDNPSYNPNKANRALISFKTQGFHQSDIDILLARIPRILNIYGISKVDIPDPNIDMYYQMSDSEFQQKLINQYKRNNPLFDEEAKEGTIYLDVKSVSAIHKLRRGNIPRKLDNSGFIFVTRNTTLAYASKVFETEVDNIESFYIPSTVTDVFVGTIIWLNSSMKFDFQKINQSRLIANCYAALHPSKQLKAQFLAEVEKTSVDGLLSSEDIMVLRSSRTAEELLQEKTLGNPKKITSKTPIEIMNEIRARAKDEANKEYKTKETAYVEQLSNAESTINALAITTEKIQEEKDEGLKALADEKIKTEKLIGRIKKSVSDKANFWGWSVFSISALLTVVVNLKDVFVILLNWTETQKLIFSVTFGVLSVIIAVFQLNGFRLKEKVIKRITRIELKKYEIVDE